MTPALMTAVKFLVKRAFDDANNVDDTFVSIMALMEKELGPVAYKELLGMSLFDIAESVHFGDIVALAKQAELAKQEAEKKAG